MVAVTGAIQLAVEVASTNSDRAAWWLVYLTGGLVFVTGVLAVTAMVALRQLREIRKDRHIAIFIAFAERWENAPMAEALAHEAAYTDETLAELFARSGEPPAPTPEQEGRRVAGVRERLILIRIPDYFEDAVMAAKRGGLDMALFRDEFGGLAIGKWERWHRAVQVIRGTEPETDDVAYVEFETFAQEALEDDLKRQAEKDAHRA